MVADLYKSILHTGQEPRLYFWRTQGGHEVDLLVERPDGLIPLEIKATMTGAADPKVAERPRREA